MYESCLVRFWMKIGIYGRYSLNMQMKKIDIVVDKDY